MQPYEIMHVDSSARCGDVSWRQMAPMSAASIRIHDDHLQRDDSSKGIDSI
ncbi:hypothetical protein BDN70DRAFT_884980, partial [Pholiota conissans]